MPESNPKILPAPNGPLIVEGLTKLRGADGAIPCKPKMALCRCGSSQNKPFCDGSHAKVGFTSEKSDDRLKDRVRDYVGKQITIHDNRSICAHAGVCTDSLPAVWRMEQKPWIAADAATAEAIIDVIRRCPSGALTYTLAATAGDASAEEPTHPSRDAEVVVTKGGPYTVSGAVEISGEVFGSGADTARFTLCRCGASKNKPFCDGTHWDVSFDEQG